MVSLAVVALIFLSVAFAADDMKAFPAAEEGMTRHVIRLPKQQDENAFKVELIIGKTVKTDASNSYFFGGALETETIPGWGFDRYILRKLGPMAGTLMAVDPDAPQVERFITIGGEARLAALQQSDPARRLRPRRRRSPPPTLARRTECALRAETCSLCRTNGGSCRRRL